jgi:hypothetical protein
MITPGFSLTATERVLPRLALDFTTASLDPRVTFTRTGNTATVTNSSGNIVGINADLPRFDYDSITLACKGLLIEESRTNQFTYSNDFSQAIWQKVGLTLSAGFVTSPDGTSNMVQLVENAGSGSKYIAQTALGTTGAQTVSIFAKYAGRQYLWISLSNSATGFYFDLQNGTTTKFGAGSETATMTLLKNGIYRCTMTRTQTITDKLYFGLSASTATFVYTGDGVSGAYVYGIQQEAGAFATSYIPTVATAPITRNADVATMTGTNFSDWFNASEGTFFGQALLGGSAQLAAIGTVRNTTSDAIVYGFLGASQTTCQIWVNNVNQADLGPARNINAVNGVCLAYKVNDVIVSNNGGATLSDNTALIPTVNAFYIGQNRVTTTSCIHIQKIAYYPQRLTNNEVLAFSKV